MSEMSFEQEKEECFQSLKEATNAREKANIVWNFLKQLLVEEVLNVVVDDRFETLIPQIYDNLDLDDSIAASEFWDNLYHLLKVWDMGYILAKMFREYYLKKDMPLESLTKD